MLLGGTDYFASFSRGKFRKDVCMLAGYGDADDERVELLKSSDKRVADSLSIIERK